METLKTVANRHDMVALLHEKPFAGVNGSGKHDNWSIDTDDGIRLLKPGENPQEDAQFLLFLTAVITAVDRYAPYLRLTAANAGNDHRLGANEAPPAIISIFLGDQLTEILDSIVDGTPYRERGGEILKIGATTLPSFPRDISDRNRTSPFAFTGSKFEFRMVGSSQSLAGPNVMLNTTVAQVLTEFAERLEQADDTMAGINAVIKEYYTTHRRVIFNGNGYSDEWVAEAGKRGLPNLTNTVDALTRMLDEECVDLFANQKVLSKEELESRLEIYLETYSKQVNIEAGVMFEMAKRLVAPAVNRYLQEIITSVKELKKLGVESPEQMKLIRTITQLMNDLLSRADELSDRITEALAIGEDVLAQAKAYRGQVVPAMAALREKADALEKCTDKNHWPYPSYEDMLFRL